jgi:hypothetical protein
MFALLSKLLVLITAALTVLPPGWCCTMPVEPAGDAAAKSAPCCCRHNQSVPCHEPVPIKQVVECCCDKDLASPPQPVTVPQDSGVFFPVAVATAPAALGGIADLVFANSPAPPQPLNILHCVSRC